MRIQYAFQMIVAIFLTISLDSCSEIKNYDQDPKHKLDDKIQSCIDSMKIQKGIIDNTYSCDEDISECFYHVVDSASKNDLELVYHNIDSTNAFKLQIFKIIYSKYPELREQLIEDCIHDSTIILHVSSCFGIGYGETYEESCFNFARKFNPDSINSLIIQKHHHLKSLTSALINAKPSKKNYSYVLDLIDDYPEAIVALSKFGYSKDSIIIQDKLNEYYEFSDTNSLVRSLRLLENPPFSCRYSRNPYKRYFEKVITDFKLHESKQYSYDIPKIIYCYLKNIDEPYIELGTILNDFYHRFNSKNTNEREKEQMIYILESIYASFLNSLNLSHYKMHEDVVDELERFLNNQTISSSMPAWGYVYDESLKL